MGSAGTFGETALSPSRVARVLLLDAPRLHVQHAALGFAPPFTSSRPCPSISSLRLSSSIVSYARYWSRLRRANRCSRWALRIVLGHTDTATILGEGSVRFRRQSRAQNSLSRVPYPHSRDLWVALQRKQQNVLSAPQQVMKSCNFVLQVMSFAEHLRWVRFCGKLPPRRYTLNELRALTKLPHDPRFANMAFPRNTFLLLLISSICTPRCLMHGPLLLTPPARCLSQNILEWGSYIVEREWTA